jgi:MFS transporter, ACS family, glucarate transporter
VVATEGPEKLASRAHYPLCQSIIHARTGELKARLISVYLLNQFLQWFREKSRIFANSRECQCATKPTLIDRSISGSVASAGVTETSFTEDLLRSFQPGESNCAVENHKLGRQSPTHVRWHILAMLTSIMMVTAFGRLNLGIAAKYLQEEFSFSTQTMGWILGAFALGYALFQIPWGWAGDRFGPRRTLTLAILWWSGTTMLMTLVPLLHLSSLVPMAWAFALVRFLTGVGEAASYPNANKVVSFWTGRSERGQGSSLLLGGVGAGGVLAPILFGATMQGWGWRSAFLISGVLAAAVSVLWFLYSTNRPEEHASINSAELELLQSTVHRGGAHSFSLSDTPWRKIFQSGSVLALIGSYFFHGYTPYIYFTWFFLYLTRVRGFTVSKSGWWGASPFIAMTLMALLGGWLSDKAVTRLGRRRGRQSTAWAGMICSGFLLWAGGHAVNNVSAILLLAFAAGFNMFAAPSWWAACIDLAPQHAGSLSGVMNMCANIAGFLAPIVTAWIATALGWPRALDFAACVSLAAAILWIFVDAGSSLEVGNEADAAPPLYVPIPNSGRSTG